VVCKLCIYKLGWDDFFENQFKSYKEQGLVPGRVVNKHKNQYGIYYSGGYIEANLAGKFRYKATQKKHFPSVGDWVAFQVVKEDNKAVIHGVLERKTSFARRAPISGGRKIKGGMIVGGRPEEQVIVSNIDTTFIVCGLDGNFNLRRIERYITLVYNSGSNPVIILNKMDICNDLSKAVDEIEAIAIGVPVHPISVIGKQNMDVFDQYLIPGNTIVFLGSSGVGKSTITNYLIGEGKQKIKTISTSNGKGRHTTTSAELLFHDSGAMIIDTPGLRELQLWGDEESIEETFEDIIKLAEGCRFSDCAHYKEPGCAVKQGVEDGVISRGRYDSYLKHLHEIRRVQKEHIREHRDINREASRKMHLQLGNSMKQGI